MPTERLKPNLVITRILAAPRDLVWKAWTDPKQVEQWWGPHGFTNPLCEWDARPGGAILVHMRGPADSPFDMVLPMKGMFHEVAAPGRLVFTSTALEDAEGKPQLETHNTITFEEYNGKTPGLLFMQRSSKRCLQRPVRSPAWSRAGRKAWNASMHCCDKQHNHDIKNE